jgi:hypothetical protein
VFGPLSAWERGFDVEPLSERRKPMDKHTMPAEQEVYETPLLVDLEEATGALSDICYTGGGCGAEVPAAVTAV